MGMANGTGILTCAGLLAGAVIGAAAERLAERISQRTKEQWPERTTQQWCQRPTQRVTERVSEPILQRTKERTKKHPALRIVFPSSWLLPDIPPALETKAPRTDPTPRKSTPLLPAMSTVYRPKTSAGMPGSSNRSQTVKTTT